MNKHPERTAEALIRQRPRALSVFAVLMAFLFLAATACWLGLLAGFASPAQASLRMVNQVDQMDQVADRIVRASFPLGEPVPPGISSAAAILIDQETGEVLFSHNADKRLPMASTTKIMTAIIALETMSLDSKVTVPAKAVATIGSKSRLQEGEVLTVEQLLYALLVVSGNDAGVALAEAAAGSVPAFVETMNQKAAELGLTNTHFVNPCGLNNSNHYSSARDLAALAQYALRNPVFSRIVNTVYFSLPPLPQASSQGEDNRRDFDNQNELLHQLAWVTGVKTGSTPYAKYCLVASGTVEGVSLIAVVLGAQEDNVRWAEARSLLEYGFSLYPRTVLVDTGELIAAIDVSDCIGRPVRLVASRPLVARLSRTDAAVGRIKLTRPLKAPVAVGDVFGTMEFTAGSERLGSVELIAAQSLSRPTLRMLLSRWSYLWPQGIPGASATAELQTPH